MGKWKKAVAALAAVPMLMALAPAANAVESDPTDSSAAQRALAAALKSNAKAAADADEPNGTPANERKNEPNDKPTNV